MPDLPQIVRDDPWLEPHTAAIRGRLDHFHHVLATIEHDHGSLPAYASTHQHNGVNYLPSNDCWIVREWAPAARSLSLIGDFNGWDREAHPLAPAGHGHWQLVLPGTALAHLQRVKLHVVGADGSRRDRIPATIRRAVQDPRSGDFSGQVWHPDAPYQWRHPYDVRTLGAPLVYEAHVGMAGEEGRVHTYLEFADHILPRVARAGYNALQMMAVQEHPYYGSFGYHVSSFFAPSSRFGTPDDLRLLIDEAHRLGLAVLLDIVHSHAIKNYAEGLNDFDGSGHQYFHAGPRGDHLAWDSKCFDYGRPEVRQFLLSNLRYWLEEFRFDGFRFDGVTSLLYHSRGHKAFGHYDDYFGADTDVDALLYLQLATTLVQQVRPGAVAVAEDMSGMPGLCRPVADGGIGFTHRLAMGLPDFWIRTLKHVRDEDLDLGELWGTLNNRRHGEATIAYAESHDQALVGDKTIAFHLMDQEMYWHMNIDDPSPVIERGIALHKLVRLVTFAFGGEGWLSFIGNEFGHPEWVDFPRPGNGWSYHYCRRQWSLVDNPALKYQFLAAFDRALVTLLGREHNLLAAPKGHDLSFDHSNKILCAERGGLVFVLNFSTGRSLPDYHLPAPAPGPWRVILDTDAAEFGGHNRIDPAVTHFTAPDPGCGRPLLPVYTPARTGLVLAPAPAPAAPADKRC